MKKKEQKDPPVIEENPQIDASMQYDEVKRLAHYWGCLYRVRNLVKFEAETLTRMDNSKTVVNENFPEFNIHFR